VDLSVADGLKGREIVVHEGVHAATGGGRPPEFTIEASVRDPSPGSSVGLELASGLVLVEGERGQALDDGLAIRRWTVALDEAARPGRLRYSITVRSRERLVVGSVSRDVTVVMRGRTGFDRADDGFAFGNRADLFGPSRPTRSVFDRTFPA
jgi:hypothetical protein